jgi:hypothetical protein
VSPARAAVRWDVLVSDVSQVVGSINLIPDPLFWQVSRNKGCSDIGWGSITDDAARSLFVVVFFTGIDDGNEYCKSKFHL